MSLLRNLLVLNKDVAVKFPSHRLGSAGTFALYGITSGGEGSMEMSILLEVVWLGASSRETRGFGAEGEKGKQVVLLPEGREGSIISMSMLQLAVTRSA